MYHKHYISCFKYNKYYTKMAKKNISVEDNVFEELIKIKLKKAFESGKEVTMNETIDFLIKNQKDNIKKEELV